MHIIYACVNDILYILFYLQYWHIPKTYNSDICVCLYINNKIFKKLSKFFKITIDNIKNQFF